MPKRAKNRDHGKKEENAAKKGIDKTTKAILYFVVGLVVIFGVILLIKYLPHAKEKQIEYNGFIFENIGGLWSTQVQKDNILYQISLHYAPWELDDVYLRGEPKIFLDLMQKYNLTGVYVTVDPELNENPYVALAYAELKFSLERAMGIKAMLSCTENRTSSCSERHIINPAKECKKRESMIIEFVNENSESLPEIVENTNCYTIKGSASSTDNMGIVKAADKFVYILYGIILQ